MFADLLEAGTSVDVFDTVQQSTGTVTPPWLLYTSHVDIRFRPAPVLPLASQFHHTSTSDTNAISGGALKHTFFEQLSVGLYR